MPWNSLKRANEEIDEDMCNGEIDRTDSDRRAQTKDDERTNERRTAEDEN